MRRSRFPVAAKIALASAGAAAAVPASPMPPIGAVGVVDQMHLYRGASLMRSTR